LNFWLLDVQDCGRSSKCVVRSSTIYTDKMLIQK